MEVKHTHQTKGSECNIWLNEMHCILYSVCKTHKKKLCYDTNGSAGFSCPGIAFCIPQVEPVNLAWMMQ